MPTISQSIRLDEVEHILGSGSGTLDFAVRGDNSYYTWHGTEDADWEIDGVATVRNVEEDRFEMLPEGESFVCEIEASSEEGNSGSVYCWSI